MADEENNEEEGTEEPPKGKGKLIIIIVVVLVLLGGGAGAFLFLGGGDKEGETGEPEVQEAVLETVQLEPFIVNLSQNTQFLKLTLVLEYDANLVDQDMPSGDEEEGEGAISGTIPTELPGVLASREAQIRDAVITVVSSKTAADVLSVEGKELLKEELLEVVNDATGLDEPPVVAVFFLEFIVQ